MGGLKRKISIELIGNKDSRAVAFSKRSKGLYSKASKLCRLSDAQIAIIATPVASNSNVSFYTFGHSSVDNVVAAFLSNQRPREVLGLGYWWEDERLAKSEDPEELRDAMDSMSKMLQDLKELRFNALQNRRGDCEDVKKKKGVIHGTHQKQILNPQSCSARVCIQDNVTVNFKGINKNTEEQTLVVSGNSNNNNSLLGKLGGSNQELDFDFKTKYEGVLMNFEMDYHSMVTTNQNMFSVSEALEDGGLVIHRDLDDDQMLAICDNNNINNNNNALLGNVGGCNQELDFDQIIDFETKTKPETLSMNSEMNDVSMLTPNQNAFYDSEAVVDGELVVHKDFYGDNIHLSNLDEDLMMLTVSDKNNNNNNNVIPENLVEFNQELDLDQLIDFETNSESYLKSLEMDGVSMVTTKNQNLCSDSEPVDDGGLMIHRDLDEDHLCFSDYFNELTSIAAI